MVIHPTEMVMKYGDLMVISWDQTLECHWWYPSARLLGLPKVKSPRWFCHILCWQRHHSGVESLPRGQIPKRLLVALVYPFCCLVQCLVLLSAVGEISTMFQSVFVANKVHLKNLLVTSIYFLLVKIHWKSHVSGWNPAKSACFIIFTCKISTFLAGSNPTWTPLSQPNLDLMSPGFSPCSAEERGLHDAMDAARRRGGSSG